MADGDAVSISYTAVFVERFVIIRKPPPLPPGVAPGHICRHELLFTSMNVSFWRWKYLLLIEEIMCKKKGDAVEEKKGELMYFATSKKCDN